MVSGMINCTGVLRSTSFPELGNDTKFSGDGNFVLSVYSSEEVVSIVNVGITSDYKFDVSQSFTSHGLYVKVYKDLFQVTWRNNDGIIPKNGTYVKAIEREFLEIYTSFLHKGNWHKYGHLNPSTKLLERYLLEITKVLEVIS